MRQFLWLLCFLPVIGMAQTTSQPASPLKVRYTIYATAGDTTETITGLEQITLTNLSDTPLTTVLIQLYPNAYGDDRSRLSEALLDKSDLRLYFSKEQEKGSVSQLDFSTDGHILSWRYSDRTEENVRVRLPAPLQRGDSIELQTPFFLKLPYNLAGFGYRTDKWTLRRWYPQLAAWSPGRGWDTTTLTDYSHIPSLRADYQLYFVSDAEDVVASSGQLIDQATRGNNQLLRHFQLDQQADLVVLVGRHGAGLPDARGAAVTPDSRRADMDRASDSAAALFRRLLPGPLAPKRPENPLWVYRATRLGLTGQTAQDEAQDGNRPLKPAFLMNLKQTDRFHYLSFSPALGYNDYDHLMAGLMIHNYQLPMNRFNFLVAPMYATNTHQVTGLAHLSYDLRYPGSWWQFSVDGSRYAYNAYDSWTNGAGMVMPAGHMDLQRFVPAIRWTKYPPQDASGEALKKSWDIGGKAYILRSDDWSVTGNDLSIATKTKVIGELFADLEDKRALYPYWLNIKVDGTPDYLRMGLTGKYFLNYDAKGDGLQLRAFAGKFFYLKQRDPLAALDYQDAFLTLSGTDGLHDFTNSQYFVGRSAFDGWTSQQMAEGDGFFKVSTPYLEDPVGVSDNWLGAINLTSDLPAGINPFALLPFRLPVRAFLDVGTYSQAWDDAPQTGRFLYDAGLQVSVLKEAVTIYFPLLYSKIYRDTYKSMGYESYFSHTIRFSINLANLRPKVLDRILPF